MADAIDQANWYREYANHGYDSGRGVVVADWNTLPRGFDYAVEAAGYVLDWPDAVSSCDDCARAIHYGDTPSYAFVGDCTILCADCLKDNSAEDYLEGLENDPSRAVNVRGFDDALLAEHGYHKVASDYENGFHLGQTDEPKEILAKLLAVNPTGRYIFKIDDAGQFDVRFAVWQAYQYEVIVGNIGSVYSGKSEDEARREYAEYLEQSQKGYGRAPNEPVTLMRDNEIILEHYGASEAEDEDEEI
jgi:hypothetical protein